MSETSRIVAGELVTIPHAPGQEPIAQDLLDLLARLALQSPLRHGFRFQFGGAILTLQSDPKGGLRLHEPAFDRDPYQDLGPGVENTLDVLARQIALARRIGAPPTEIDFTQFIVAARGALHSPRLHLLRSAVGDDPEDCGWTLTSPDDPADPNDDDAFDAFRVYELFLRRPAVLGALALPFGFAAVFHGDRLTSVLDSTGLELLTHRETPPHD